MDLAEQYRRYLDVLDAHRFDELGEFVHDRFERDGEPWTLADFQALLRDDVARIPDLKWTPQLVVVHGDTLAARLWFDCHPVGEFHGLPTAGRRIAFAEHIFYTFRDGRMAQMWSLLDLEAVRAQLAG